MGLSAADECELACWYSKIGPAASSSASPFRLVTRDKVVDDTKRLITLQKESNRYK